MKFPYIVSFFVLFLSSQLIAQSETESDSTSRLSHLDAEIFAGIGLCTEGFTNEAVELSAFYRNNFLEARFYRSRGDNYFFENSVLVGRRFPLLSGYNVVLGIGYTNSAFENEDATGPSLSPHNFNKYGGIILQSNFGYTFHRKDGLAYPIAISLHTYALFTAEKNVAGFSGGVSVLPFGFVRSSYVKQSKVKPPKPRVLHVPEREATFPMPMHNIFRTNLLVGILHEPHLDYEHVINDEKGFYFSAAFRLADISITSSVLSLYENPDFSLEGPALLGGWNWYHPTKHGYRAVGIRTGYRYLTQSRYWVGTGSDYDPSWVISRVRKDILLNLHWEVNSCGKHGHAAIGLFFNGGIRVSDYWTHFFSTYGNPLAATQGIDAQFRWPKNGVYVRPDFSCGVTMGFGK